MDDGARHHSVPLRRVVDPRGALVIADGPDAVHHLVVGRNELRRYESSDEDVTSAAVWRS